jgi:hypothetical protein
MYPFAMNDKRAVVGAYRNDPTFGLVHGFMAATYFYQLAQGLLRYGDFFSRRLNNGYRFKQKRIINLGHPIGFFPPGATSRPNFQAPVDRTVRRIFFSAFSANLDAAIPEAWRV